MRPVIYVHGYGSTGETDTAKNLRRIVEGEFEVISPTYNCSDPLGARAALEDLLLSLKDRSPIIVGTSLGGFFANVLARRGNIPAVLVNPALKPSASLHKYGESAEVLAGYLEVEEDEQAQTALPARFVVLGERDDVVDPHKNGALLTGNVQPVWVDMGHRIEPAFYETIAGLVRALRAA